LYNTSEVIYKSYKLNIDPLIGVEYEEGVKEELNIDDAPASLTNDDDFGFNIENILFKPNEKELPTLDLPLVLDLPNVIDIKWEIQDSFSIAPSSNNLLNLPKVVSETKTDGSGQNNSVLADSDVPPPPPPPPDENNKIEYSDDAPPPPPPPIFDNDIKKKS